MAKIHLRNSGDNGFLMNGLPFNTILVRFFVNYVFFYLVNILTNWSYSMNLLCEMFNVYMGRYLRFYIEVNVLCDKSSYLMFFNDSIYYYVSVFIWVIPLPNMFNFVIVFYSYSLMMIYHLILMMMMIIVKSPPY